MSAQVNGSVSGGSIDDATSKAIQPDSSQGAAAPHKDKIDSTTAEDAQEQNSDDPDKPGVSFLENLSGLKFDINEQFTLVRATMTETVTGAYNDRYGLEDAELKLIEQSFTDYITQKLPCKPYAVTDVKKRLLLRRKDMIDADRDFLNQAASLSAVITVMEGRSSHSVWNEEKWFEQDLAKLSEDRRVLEYLISTGHVNEGFHLETQLKFTAAKYREIFVDKLIDVNVLNNPEWKRIYYKKNDKNRHSDLRYRWTRVQIVDQDAAYTDSDKLAWRHGWVQDHLREDGHSNLTAQIYYIDLKLDTSTVTLHSLLQAAKEASHDVELNYQYAAAKALLKVQYGADDENVAVHGHKFFDCRDERTSNVLALKHVVGTRRILKLDSSEQILVMKGACTNLFIPGGAVIDFIHQRSGPTPPEFPLKETLVGRRVVVNNEDGLPEIKTICSIDETPSVGIGRMRRHHTMSSDESIAKLQYPSLPCLNIGTPARPQVVAPELCQFAHMQSYRKPITQRLSDSMEAFKADPTKTDQQKLKIGPVHYPKALQGKATPKKQVFGMPSAELSIEKKDEQIKSAFPDGGPNILFAEVGTKSILSPSWENYCKQLVGHPIFQQNGRPRQDELWKSQLKGHISSNISAKRLRDRKTVLVIGIRHGQDQKRLYSKLKPLCDIQCDIQSFFVDVSGIEKKLKKAEKENADREVVLQKLAL